MNFPRRSVVRLVAVVGMWSPLAMRAHPGHEHVDPVWDFSAGHLGAHPVATLVTLALLGGGAWVASRIGRWPAKPVPVRVRAERR